MNWSRQRTPLLLARPEKRGREPTDTDVSRTLHAAIGGIAPSPPLPRKKATEAPHKSAPAALKPAAKRHLDPHFDRFRNQPRDATTTALQSHTILWYTKRGLGGLSGFAPLFFEAGN